MLKVSIITPTYQRAATLPRALSSALAQTFRDFELIVVDDGSTDDTRSVVEAINDTRIHYHYQPNQGPAVARNTGIHHATGAYVALLDADDAWHSSKLEQQIALLDTYPDIHLVFTDSENIDTENNTCALFSEQQRSVLEKLQLTPLVVNQYRRGDGFASGSPYTMDGYHVEHPTLREILYERNFIATSSIMLRRDVLLNIGGFNPALFNAQDTDLLLRLLPAAQFAYIEAVLAVRYKDAFSISRRSERFLLNLIKFHEIYLNTDLHTPAKRQLKQTYRSLARLYGRSGSLRKAARTFRASLQYGFDPTTALYTIGAVFGPLPFVVGGAASRWRNAHR